MSNCVGTKAASSACRSPVWLVLQLPHQPALFAHEVGAASCQLPGVRQNLGTNETFGLCNTITSVSPSRHISNLILNVRRRLAMGQRSFHPRIASSLHAPQDMPMPIMRPPHKQLLVGEARPPHSRSLPPHRTPFPAPGSASCPLNCAVRASIS